MFSTFPDSQRPQRAHWKNQLDRFIDHYEKQLAALIWGIAQDPEKKQETLGIDLKPSPHFVFCPRTALETLNKNTKNSLQEILGLIDGYNPEQEYLMIVIGEGEIQLILRESNPPPPRCFEEVGLTVAELLAEIEIPLATEISLWA